MKSSRKRTTIDLPRTRNGTLISLDLVERTVYQAVKKAGKKGLPGGEAEQLFGRKLALTTRLATLRKLQGYGVISVERTVGGGAVYKVITGKPGPKSGPRLGETRYYQCSRHPHYRVRNAAKFVDGVFETDNLETQELLEGLTDFGILIVQISPAEAQAVREAARSKVVQAVRS